MDISSERTFFVDRPQKGRVRDCTNVEVCLSLKCENLAKTDASLGPGETKIQVDPTSMLWTPPLMTNSSCVPGKT